MALADRTVTQVEPAAALRVSYASEVLLADAGESRVACGEQAAGS